MSGKLEKRKIEKKTKSKAILIVRVMDDGDIEITTQYTPTLDELKQSQEETLPMSHIVVNDLFQQLNKMGQPQEQTPKIIIPK